MKTCPKCKLKVGGDPEFCPVCQGMLLGEGEAPLWPKVVPPARQLSLVYKLLAFGLLALAVVCVAVDWLWMDPPLHWSLVVVLCVVAFLGTLRFAIRTYQSVPRLLFQLLLAVSLVALACDWYTGWHSFSLDWVIPILCSITLLVNFVFSFLRVSFAENCLVYLLMNILVGVVPYLFLLLREGPQPVAWVLCLLVSIITFLGLVVFRGRELLGELQRRLHL